MLLESRQLAPNLPDKKCFLLIFPGSLTNLNVQIKIGKVFDSCGVSRVHNPEIKEEWTL
jgi:hypothetical protein